MQIIRRLYRYLISFISLEVIVWGLINLARATFSGEIIGQYASQLAGALALIFVGVPTFLLHWIPTQRRASEDPEEKFSRVRALFLYGALLALLIPITQNALAIINRLWLLVFQLPSTHAVVGYSQNWIDNVIAVIINGLGAWFIFYITHKNWISHPTNKAFRETRRLFRYIWVLYSLALATGGVLQVAQYIFTFGETLGASPQARLANGLAMLIVGVPLWAYTWQHVQKSLIEPDEQQSLLRLIVLYILSFVGAGGVLIPAGIVINVVLRVILGESAALDEVFHKLNTPLSSLIALGSIWLYYGKVLKNDIGLLPETPRRSGLQRTYYYVLAFFGLGAAFIGVQMLVFYITDSLLGSFAAENIILRERLSAALATLFVGLPLWTFTWQPMNKQAAQDGESGDHARRSLVRKIYIYLIFFIGVIGVMASGGGLIFELLKALFGDPTTELLRTSLTLLETLGLFTLVMLYHGNALRSDNRRAANWLATRHAEYPTLIIAEEAGEFTDMMTEALGREAETLPVAVFLVEEGTPDEDLSAARAVVLPAFLGVSPPEALRLWLRDFEGQRIVVPTPTHNWYWLFSNQHDLASAARQTAKIVRHLAEEEAIPKLREHSGWRIVLYVLAGMLSLPFFFSLLSWLFM